MSLIVPPWMQELGVEDSRRKFDWTDPWKCEFENSRMQNRIGVLWSRAILALAAGFAEWVVWRLDKQARDPVVLQFLEASWAAVVDRRYLNHVTKKLEGRIRKSYELPKQPQRLETVWNLKRDFSDPVRGPQCVAIRILAEVADLTAPRDFGSMEAVYLSNLVEQVVGKAEPFKSWRRGAITRFTKLYGCDSRKKNWLGPPVPREALDLDMKFTPEIASPLLDKFLTSLDYRKNPFLVPADTMRKLGFEGTPYTYR